MPDFPEDVDWYYPADVLIVKDGEGKVVAYGVPKIVFGQPKIKAAEDAS